MARVVPSRGKLTVELLQRLATDPGSGATGIALLEPIGFGARLAAERLVEELASKDDFADLLEDLLDDEILDADAKSF